LSDPAAHCQPAGVPAISATPLPYKIVQTPKMVMILYEGESVFRQIFLDARRPVEDLLEYFCAENENDVQHFQ
jgi:hypothetical protein